MFELQEAPEACPNRRSIRHNNIEVGYYWCDTGNVNLMMPGPPGFANHVVEFLRSQGLDVNAATQAARLDEVEQAINESLDDDD